VTPVVYSDRNRTGWSISSLQPAYDQVMASVWPLVGRAEELRLIDAAVTGADDYDGVVIAGPPGVGKSRLAHEAITNIRPGRWVPRWVRATASARTLPLGAFAEWTGDPAKDPMLVIRDVIDHLTTAPPGTRVIVGVDDAHLLDDQSAFVVHQLVQRRLAKVVVTLRTGEIAPDAVTALWKDGLLQRIELQPLSESETADLVAAVLEGRLERTSAQQLWAWTRGNILYLRHLLEQELASHRLTEHQGVWEWTGRPVVSPGLADLIGTQIGALPSAVGMVLDFLAVGEPLTEQMLADLISSDAVEAAHTAGLITIDDHGHHHTRLAHPLYGEVRRAQTTPLHLRRLSAQVAEAFGAEPDADIRGLVRRAVLTLESDLPPDPDLFTKAAQGALSLLDPELAERLTASALAAGGGFTAQFIRAMATMSVGRGRETEEIFARLLTGDLTDKEIVDVTNLRIANLLFTLDRPEQAEPLIREVMEKTRPELHGSLIACRGFVCAYQGHPLDAVDTANRALRYQYLNDFGAVAAMWALLVALSDLGKADQIAPIASRADELIATSSLVSTARFTLCDFHTRGLQLGGYVREADEGVARICREVEDVPGWAQTMRSMLLGRSALAAGRLGEAQYWLTQPFTVPEGTSGCVPEAWFCALAQAHAILGDQAAAERIMRRRASLENTGFARQTSERLLTRAWVAAAAGTITESITLARQGATYAAAHHQYAQEVVCLHTATRFGDHTASDRLQELASQVDGPRAPAAAKHAASLAADDADGLLDASKQFEELGDLLSAVDAAAHSATAHRHHGRNGSALAAAARAQRLANTCGGAITPALREAQQPSPLTSRQREIVTLAAHGLTNKQIADKLTVSVRTIEGHLYRASLKTGTTDRNDLGATITGD